MKYSLTATALVGCAVAFPTLPKDAFDKLPKRAASIQGDGVPDPAYLANYFNPEEQYTSNQGQYAFVAPSSTDNRGPCPGLNAMANHGYLPHNGVANIQQFITGTGQAFGMGVDLAGFLAVFGSIFDGNGYEWSIGGPTSDVPSIGLLGTPEGISGSHNKYEADVSPTRGDLYQYGDDYTVQVSQFSELYNWAGQGSMSDAESNYNLDVLRDFRSSRFDQSIANNPYFFNAPFSGVLVQPAAYTFIYRFMSNKSAEYPEGQLTQSVLKSFFSVQGPDANGDFTYTHGYEAIPDNWYKRSPTVSPYTIPFFNGDLIAEAAKYPKFLNIGGNTGKVNTFTPVDLANLTGGVYNAQTFTPQNAICLAYESTVMASPDILSGIFTDPDPQTSALKTAVQSALSAAGLTCPTLTTIDNNQFNVYPGYTRSGGAS